MMASAMLRARAVLGDEWAGGHALLTLERMRRENPEPDAVAHTPGGMSLVCWTTRCRRRPRHSTPTS